MPYGYYQFLRIVVSGCSLWIAFWNHQKDEAALALVFGVVCVIFNPIFKVHMEREMHLYFNIATALILTAALAFEKFSVRRENRD